MILTRQSDTLGAVASSLCAFHCFVTPILFAVQTCSAACTHGSSTPSWWGFIDYIFIGVSLLAVYASSKSTSSNWIKYLLWGSWILCATVIFMEKTQLLSLPEITIYFPSLLLAFLHLYNRKHFSCKESQC